ncbi:MAG: hypothetical protein ACKVOU_02055 [Cytophagales bacterium]
MHDQTLFRVRPIKLIGTDTFPSMDGIRFATLSTAKSLDNRWLDANDYQGLQPLVT